MDKDKLHQGDVLLIPVESSLVKGFKVIGKEIVQHGELTGHAHKVVGSVVKQDENTSKRYVCLKSDGVMTHEDHPATAIPAGTYEIRIQQEFFPSVEGKEFYKPVLD